MQAIAPDSAEQRRWCRASFVDLYFAWFNAPPHTGSGKGEATSTKKRTRLRNELHWALSAVNNCRCVRDPFVCNNVGIAVYAFDSRACMRPRVCVCVSLPHDAHRSALAYLSLHMHTYTHTSTEHLSLLHACYESAGHQDGANSKLSRY